MKEFFHVLETPTRHRAKAIFEHTAQF